MIKPIIKSMIQGTIGSHNVVILSYLHGNQQATNNAFKICKTLRKRHSVSLRFRWSVTYQISQKLGEIGQSVLYKLYLTFNFEHKFKYKQDTALYIYIGLCFEITNIGPTLDINGSVRNLQLFYLNSTHCHFHSKTFFLIVFATSIVSSQNYNHIYEITLHQIVIPICSLQTL